jgi:hypothetical protein
MVDRQVEIIAERRAKGSDTTSAVETLAIFTEILTTMTVYRAGVAQRLTEGKSPATSANNKL